MCVGGGGGGGVLHLTEEASEGSHMVLCIALYCASGCRKYDFSLKGQAPMFQSISTHNGFQRQLPSN